MQTPEGKIKGQVKQMLDKYGAYHHWPVQNGMGAPCLDCHGCYGGWYFAIETKAPGKNPTPRQRKTMIQIQQNHGMVLVIDGPKGLAILESWLRAHKATMQCTTTEAEPECE